MSWHERAEHFQAGLHLPHNRAEGQGPADPYELPRQRVGTTPQMHGRYPDFDVLEGADHWDAVTRATVLGRLDPSPSLRTFAPGPARTLERFLDVVLAQDAEPRVPVLPVIDARLADGAGVGYRFDGMPTDRDVWFAVARGLDDAARDGDAADFAKASKALAERIVDALADGSLEGPAWDGLDLSHTWSIVTRDAVDAFYRHPWAWNEIGFGGPAYPRGRMRMDPGPSGADPNEGREAFDIDAARDVAGHGS